ncbi:MAG: hypothetical protein LBL97_09410 [Prevotellaceae bacterium]|jgi:hypothetical protein|nr:hypothetical protein [Prevotellaceae bacterium]
MKYIRILAALTLVFVVSSAFSFQKKDKQKKEEVVYAFAVATSFKDTVVYITEIQVLDSARLDKDGFLEKRTIYPYQLKNYLEFTKHAPDYTCTLSFSTKKEKLVKELTKLKSKLKKEKTNVLTTLSLTDFKFTKPE